MSDAVTERTSALSTVLEKFFEAEHIDPDGNPGAKSLRRELWSWAASGKINYDSFDMVAEQIPLSADQQERLIQEFFSIYDFAADNVEEEDFQAVVDPNQSAAMDVISCYRRDLANPACEPLKKEESKKLWEKISAAREAEITLNDPECDLSEEDRKQLAAIIKAGDRAKERVSNGVLRYAFTVTRNIFDSVVQPSETAGVYNFAEAISQANEGIMEAMHHYDPSRECSFQYYCVFWIRKYVYLGLNNMMPFHVSPHVHRDYAKIKRAEGELAVIGDDPTPENIQRLTGMSVRRIKDVQKQISHMQVRRIDDMVPNEDQSNSAWKGKSSDRVMELSQVDKLYGDGRVPEETEKLLAAMKKYLDPIDAKVMILVVGLEDSQSRTFEEVGNFLGYTKQNIKKIFEHGRAILHDKLRTSEVSGMLHVLENREEALS